MSTAPRQSGATTAQLTLFGGASGLGAAVTARELLDASRRIDEFLLAREKRVTGGANADFNVTPGRTGCVPPPRRMRQTISVSTYSG